MHTQTTQTKRFAQHVKCCEWYYDEIENVINDAFLTDEEKIMALDDLENRILLSQRLSWLLQIKSK
jgi:hypothetical protein